MFGVFGLLNLLISAVYPIVASFKAYDNYSQLAVKTGATTFNVGGVSIPLGTILKKATAVDNEVKEDTLNSRLLSVQMWLIYWIVNAAVSTVENIFYLKWIPLYAPIRFIFSLWLIAPILVGSAKLKSTKALTFNDIQQEWAKFSGQGCGLIYFGYLRPFLDENVGLLNRISFEPLLASLSGKFVLPLAQQIGLLSLLSRNQAPQSNLNTYSEIFSEYANVFRLGPVSATGEPGSTSFGDISEYDVVDKPSSSDEYELKNRGALAAHEDGLKNTLTVSGAKPSWFW